MEIGLISRPRYAHLSICISSHAVGVVLDQHGETGTVEIMYV